MELKTILFFYLFVFNGVYWLVGFFTLFNVVHLGGRFMRRQQSGLW